MCVSETIVMSTTKKYRLFVSEPVGIKKVGDLPGVGPELARRFEKAHFATVSYTSCNNVKLPQ